MEKSLSSENFVFGDAASRVSTGVPLTLRHLLPGAGLLSSPARHLSSVPADHRHRTEADAAPGELAQTQLPSLILAARPRRHPIATEFAREGGSLDSDSDQIQALFRTA